MVVATAVLCAEAFGLSAGVPAGIAAASLGVAAVSALDDLRPLASEVRLTVQVLCAMVAVMSIGSPPVGLSPLAAAALGVVWVVGLTNAYNFMDGIDGIAGAQAVVGGGAVAAAAAVADLRSELVTGVAIAAASGGFLLYNWSPARVFMGDVGSAFLGFVFAVLALLIGQTSVPLALVVVASLWPFLFDTSLTLVRRAARRENLLVAHRSHLYQRLVIAGWSHAQVTVLYAAAALTGAAAALTWATSRAPGSALLLVPLMAVTLWGIVARREAVVARSTERLPTERSAR
jgi:UDP-N-acetylmuramyl pentapeptide phosphotransferase/UDP-N-acetylglucosamine-1-phosphate transferase